MSLTIGVCSLDGPHCTVTNPVRPKCEMHDRKLRLFRLTGHEEMEMRNVLRDDNLQPDTALIMIQVLLDKFKRNSSV